MLITKREHAFLDIADGAQPGATHLLIDPGSLTANLDAVHAANVAAVVITHQHPDHVTGAHLEAVLAANADAKIFADEAVAALVAPIPVEVVTAGDVRQAGPFTLEFVGGQHALIHNSIKQVANVGVIVNETLYHPGDSFDLPGRPVTALAVPTSGPWMKLGEAIDFIQAVNAPVNFGIHDAAASDFGNSLSARNLTAVAEAAGHAYRSLGVGDTLEV